VGCWAFCPGDVPVFYTVKGRDVNHLDYNLTVSHVFADASTTAALESRGNVVASHACTNVLDWILWMSAHSKFKRIVEIIAPTRNLELAEQGRKSGEIVLFSSCVFQFWGYVLRARVRCNENKFLHSGFRAFRITPLMNSCRELISNNAIPSTLFQFKAAPSLASVRQK
jgi:hypothetical protein